MLIEVWSTSDGNATNLKYAKVCSLYKTFILHQKLIKLQIIQRTYNL